MKTSSTYPGYTGDKHWRVCHPDYSEDVIVTAPNADAAIVTAAGVLGRRWTEISWYASAKAVRA